MSRSTSLAKLRRIAIVNPLNDYGIAGYTHEFAEGLASNGYSVSIYSDLNAPLQELPAQRHYDVYPVLGRALVKQASLPRLLCSVEAVQRASSVATFNWDAYSLQLAPVLEEGQSAIPVATGVHTNVPRMQFHNMRRARAAGNFTTQVRFINRQLHGWLRIRYLSSELAYHLHRKRYDLIWTQWYSPDVFDSAFWRICRSLKIPVIHTAHNVLPHECKPGDREVYNKVYGHAKLLIVHSQQSQAELQSEYPQHAPKSIVMPHGTYSSLHKRVPEARERVRRALGIDAQSPVLLFCGAIRPYKNIEAVIGALAEPEFSDVTLVIAGKESKYPDSNSNDPLQRTKALLAKQKISCRLRMIPRMLETTELSEVLEASDVLLLPYLKGYGSGLLLLGMTFGKHIVATGAGGSEEYLRHYANHTMLSGPSSREVAIGLKKAIARIRQSSSPATPPEILSWPNVTGVAMETIKRRLGDCA